MPWVIISWDRFGFAWFIHILGMDWVDNWVKGFLKFDFWALFKSRANTFRHLFSTVLSVMFLSSALICYKK